MINLYKYNANYNNKNKYNETYFAKKYGIVDIFTLQDTDDYILKDHKSVVVFYNKSFIFQDSTKAQLIEIFMYNKSSVGLFINYCKNKTYNMSLKDLIIANFIVWSNISHKLYNSYVSEKSKKNRIHNLLLMVNYLNDIYKTQYVIDLLSNKIYCIIGNLSFNESFVSGTYGWVDIDNIEVHHLYKTTKDPGYLNPRGFLRSKKMTELEVHQYVNDQLGFAILENNYHSIYHANLQSKISDQDLVLIRKLLREGKTQREIAKILMVNQRVIWKFAKRYDMYND